MTEQTRQTQPHRNSLTTLFVIALVLAMLPLLHVSAEGNTSTLTSTPQADLIHSDTTEVVLSTHVPAPSPTPIPTPSPGPTPTQSPNPAPTPIPTTIADVVHESTELADEPHLNDPEPSGGDSTKPAENKETGELEPAAANATAEAPAEVQLPESEAESVAAPGANLDDHAASPEDAVDIAEPTAELTEAELLDDSDQLSGKSVVATPAVELKLVAPLAVELEGGTDFRWQNCQPFNDQMTAGQSITVVCDYYADPGNNGWNRFTIERPTMPGSLQASVAISPVTANISQGGYIGLDMGSTQATGQVETQGQKVRILRVSITFSIPNPAPVGAVPMTFVGCFPDSSSCRDLGITLHGSAPSVVLADGVNYQVDCTSPSLQPEELGADMQSICTVSGLDNLGSAQFHLNRITWNLTSGSGWSVTVAGQSLSGELGQIVPGTLPIISLDNSFEFSVVFTPTACSAQPVSPQVTLGVQVTPVGQTAGSDTSNTPVLSATYAAPVTDFSAALTAAPGAVSVPYSMTSAQSGTASFTARYMVSGCSDWTSYAQMSPFTNTSDPFITTVPTLERATPGGTTIVGNGTTTVTEDEIQTITTAPTRLMVGTAPGQQVTVEQTINLEYQVPANTPVGTYESTITVSMLAAP